MTIAVEHISHSFGSLEVLRDVSFRVAPGEVFGVVGPSGCGKSTLLSIIGGVLEPTAGRALIGVETHDSLNPLTFVFQDFALLPWRTVWDNVGFALEHLSLPARDRRALIDDALSRTRLTEFAHFFPKQLSGGMRQRVGLARALVVRPVNMLMDEPLSALDAQTSEILMADLTELLSGSGSRLSVIYVTHNLEEAVALSDRIVVLSRRPGRVKEILELPIPRCERRGETASIELMRQKKKLWGLIREEATTADREVMNV
jgi:NitT/TauT family transport system ATP-binding protein